MEHEDDEFEFESECQTCGGDGYVYGDETDPLNFSPDELLVCSNCRGSGLKKDQTFW